MFINKTHLSPVYKPVIRERHAYCQLYIAMIRDREDNQQICGNFRLNALTHKSIPPYKSDTTTTHSPGLQLVGDTIT